MEDFIGLLKELLNGDSLSPEQREAVIKMLKDYQSQHEKQISDIKEALKNI